MAARGRPATLPCIYGLYDKAGALRYIGKANDPHERLKRHMIDCRRRDTPLYRWIRKNGLPKMAIIRANCEDWQAAERDFIAVARSQGEKLLNVADGGDMPHCSIETRRANGRKNGTALMADPRRKKIRDNKAWIMRTVRWLERNGYNSNAERLKAKMRHYAELRPDVFGDWACV